MNCQNCETVLIGDFCHACGQKSKTHRITFKTVVHDFIHALTHADKGFLVLLKALIIKPGVVAREYIAGKRKKYFNPLTFLVLSTAVGVYLVSVTDFYASQDVSRIPQHTVWYDLMTFANKHMKTLDVFLLAPLITIVGWMFFRKPRHNLAEHFVLQAFVLGQGVNIRTIIFVPLLVALPAYGDAIRHGFQVTLLAYMVFAYRQFFGQHIVFTILKTILMMLLYIVLFWSLVLGIVYSMRLL